MRENMQTLNRDKTDIVVLKNGESKFEQLHYNGIFREPKTNRYLGIMIDSNLNLTYS